MILTAESITNQFTDVMNDVLIRAFNEKDTPELQKLAKNLKLMDRSALFMDMYIERIAAFHLVSWKRLYDIGSIPDRDKIAQFFEDILAACIKESSFQKAFLEGYEIIPEFINYLVQHLDPSISELLSKLGAQQFPSIVELFLQSYAFSNEFTELLDRNPNGCLDDLFLPFIKYQKEFFTFEDMYLQMWLSKHINIIKHPVLRDITLISQAASMSISRCTSFTFGYASMLTALSLSKFFNSIVEQSRNEIKSLPDVTVTGSNNNSSEFNLVMINLTDADWAQFNTRISFFDDSINFLKYLNGLNQEFSTLRRVDFESVPESMQKELRALNRIISNPFEEILSTVENYCVQSQGDVLSSLFVHIKPHIDAISRQDWNNESSNQYGNEIPQFSQSPLTYITAIGEYLLTLPQQLDALVQNEQLLTFSRKLPHLLESDLAEMEQENSSECGHLWISSIVRCTEALLLSQILEIPILSNNGRQQLCADIAYFSNILAALDIDLNPDFAKMLELMQLGSEELIKELEVNVNEDKNIMRVVGKIRGLY